MGGEQAASVLATVHRDAESWTPEEAEAFKAPIRERLRGARQPLARHRAAVGRRHHRSGADAGCAGPGLRRHAERADPGAGEVRRVQDVSGGQSMRAFTMALTLGLTEPAMAQQTGHHAGPAPAAQTSEHGSAEEQRAVLAVVDRLFAALGARDQTALLAEAIPEGRATAAYTDRGGQRRVVIGGVAGLGARARPRNGAARRAADQSPRPCRGRHRDDLEPLRIRAERRLLALRDRPFRSGPDRGPLARAQPDLDAADGRMSGAVTSTLRKARMRRLPSHNHGGGGAGHFRGGLGDYRPAAPGAVDGPAPCLERARPRTARARWAANAPSAPAAET